MNLRFSEDSSILSRGASTASWGSAALVFRGASMASGQPRAAARFAQAASVLQAASLLKKLSQRLPLALCWRLAYLGTRDTPRPPSASKAPAHPAAPTTAIFATRQQKKRPVIIMGNSCSSFKLYLEKKVAGSITKRLLAADAKPSAQTPSRRARDQL